MGVQVTGELTTTAVSDTYNTHRSTLGNGGLHEVANSAARNAITTERRNKGMLVYTQDTGKYWSLTASTNTGTDADWTELPFGSGAAASSQEYNFPTASSSWSMTHSFGGYPSVRLLDLNGEEFDGAISYPDTSHVVATFLVDGGMAGKAILEK